jgi:hypothetical protein
MSVTIIKKDLLGSITDDKYYQEAELLRLVENESIPYREKINKISSLLEKIALTNTKLQLVQQYFKKKDEIKEKQ